MNLKPCPFACGHTLSTSRLSSGSLTVRCPEHTESMTAEEWNDRAPAESSDSYRRVRMELVRYVELSREALARANEMRRERDEARQLPAESPEGYKRVRMELVRYVDDSEEVYLMGDIPCPDGICIIEADVPKPPPTPTVQGRVVA